MSEGREKIAELYFRSNSVRFGRFRWTYHKANPELPDAPWYLHYPDHVTGEPGTELLPELHKLIGGAFYDLCNAQTPPVRPKKIASIPKGADPLAEAHAKQYADYPNNLVRFKKNTLTDGLVRFDGPRTGYEPGDELVFDDDHISRSFNKQLIVPVARQAGFIVNHVLTVVDHEQGGEAALADIGINLLSIMTARYLLEFGLAEGHVTAAQYEEIHEFQENNQF